MVASSSLGSDIECIPRKPKTVFIFGSEGKGLRKLSRKKCDSIISIPTNKNAEFKIESLNVSNASYAIQKDILHFLPQIALLCVSTYK